MFSPDDLLSQIGRELALLAEMPCELGKARGDEYTERLLAFVQEIENTCPHICIDETNA
jgi:hypothetical protein